jgi:hypothetical protein
VSADRTETASVEASLGVWWLPISTAPRDGTRIVVSDGESAEAVQWCVATRMWRTRGGIRWEGAEWWVPRPAAPEGDGRRAATQGPIDKTQ